MVENETYNNEINVLDYFNKILKEREKHVQVSETRFKGSDKEKKVQEQFAKLNEFFSFAEKVRRGLGAAAS